jgi:hypothetical protein
MAMFTHSLQQIVHKLRPQGPAQPPSDLEARVQDHITGWANLMIAFVLAFAPTIPLTYAQIYSKFSSTFHVLSFEFLLSFDTFFMSKFMKPKFPVLARGLNVIGIFFARLLHSYYDTISSVPPNYHLGGLCHFRSCDFSFHFVPSRILVFGAISLGWSMPFQLTCDSLVDSDLVF